MTNLPRQSSFLIYKEGPCYSLKGWFFFSDLNSAPCHILGDGAAWLTDHLFLFASSPLSSLLSI